MKPKRRRRVERKNKKQGGRAEANRRSARLSKLKKKIRVLLRLFKRERKIQDLKSAIAACLRSSAATAAPSKSAPSFCRPLRLPSRTQSIGGGSGGSSASLSASAVFDVTPLPVVPKRSNSDVIKPAEAWMDDVLDFDFNDLPGQHRGVVCQPQSMVGFSVGGLGNYPNEDDLPTMFEGIGFDESFNQFHAGYAGISA